MDVTEIRDLADKIKAVAEQNLGPQAAMLDFDDRNLLDMAEQAGFRQVHLDLERQIAEEHRPRTWDQSFGGFRKPPCAELWRLTVIGTPGLLS